MPPHQYAFKAEMKENAYLDHNREAAEIEEVELGVGCLTCIHLGQTLQVA